MKGTLLCIFFFALALPFTHGKAYCTYHMYSSSDSLTTVACSDGANGIMTKFGYSNLEHMYPYVTAFSGATWNSPNCGSCVQVTSSSGTHIYLTVIDQCGFPPGGYDAHFDIAPPAFQKLFGDDGVNAGVQDANWQVVDGANCQGNKGGGSPSNHNPVPNPPSKPNPVPNPPSQSNTKNRCGKDWADASNKSPCDRKPCPNGFDSECPKGEHCFADIGTCNRAVAEGEFTNEVVEENSAVENFDSAVAENFDAAVEENFDVVEENFDAVEENFDSAVGEDFDAAVEENFDASNVEGSFDAAVEETVDAAVEETANFAVEETVAAVIDAAYAGELETSFEQNYDAVVKENLDAAVVENAANQAADSTNVASSSGMQGWLVGIVVLFSVCAVLLVSVIALVLVYLRK